jgi:Cd2+/Zn2+-exporting ATPase
MLPPCLPEQTSAMGGLVSDAAIEAADIVIMTDEPSRLLLAMEIAGKTKKLSGKILSWLLGLKGLS